MGDTEVTAGLEAGDVVVVGTARGLVDGMRVHYGASRARETMTGLREPVIELTAIRKTYTKDAAIVHALRGIDLTINAGEFAAIMGRSGSGKSTLLHIIGLLDAEYEGSYRFNGTAVQDRSPDALAQRRNRDIGFVFQSFHCCRNSRFLEKQPFPRSTLATGVRTSAVRWRGIACARWGCSRVSTTNRWNSRTANGSARQSHAPSSMARGSSSPTSLPALSIARQADEILEIMLELHRGGTTLVMVTHDREVAEVAERTIHILDGQTSDGMA